MAKDIDDSTMSWTVTLLAVPPIGFFFVSDVLRWNFAAQTKVSEFRTLDFAASQVDATNRLFVIAAALAGFGLAYLITLRFLADLRDEFGPDMRTWILRWYCGGVLVGALWVVGGYWFVPAGVPLGADYLDRTLGWLSAASETSRATLPQRFQVLAMCNRFAFMLAAGMVVTGGISALVEPIRTLDADEAYAFWRHQRLRLRGYVNAAAALLVAGLVFEVAWMRWTLVALPPAAADLMGRHVDASALFTGVGGSVVIALFAVPAATILDARMRAKATPPKPGDGPAASVFKVDLLPTLGKALVILAPTLAGSLPAILDLIEKAAA